MLKAYCVDIRMRVIAHVEGGASRREATEQLDISLGAAVKWVKCFQETGTCAAKPRGGSTSPLEAHAPWLPARRLPVLSARAPSRVPNSREASAKLDRMEQRSIGACVEGSKSRHCFLGR